MDELKSKIIPVIEKYGVRKVALFGSQVKGTADEESDVDILIECAPQMGFRKFFYLKQDLETLLNKKVDLVTYGALHPYLRDRILAEQNIIYER